MSAKLKKALFYSLILLVFSLPNLGKNEDGKNRNARENVFRVKKVIDGDTIEIETGQKVRYIGIDTPELKNRKKETECFAKEAQEQNKKIVKGKLIYLEKDVSDKDKYGRLLRYVFILDEKTKKPGVFVNDVLVKNGYALVSTFPPDVKYTQQFLKSQKEAREKKTGLWTSCDNTP